jgi:hypothetical protein
MVERMGRFVVVFACFDWRRVESSIKAADFVGE